MHVLPLLNEIRVLMRLECFIVIYYAKLLLSYKLYILIVWEEDLVDQVMAQVKGPGVVVQVKEPGVVVQVQALHLLAPNTQVQVEVLLGVAIQEEETEIAGGTAVKFRQIDDEFT